MSTGAAAASWDAEYASGRYCHDPPVGFTRDIIGAARSGNLRRGLYIGCGNGRNLVPLSDAGLDLIGLDISARAVGQLRERRPGAARLVVGGIDALRPSAEFDLVIGIQVFQHGNRGQAHRHLAGAAAHVAPGGLLCVRVNATGTDIRHRHERTEEAGDGGFTVRYLDGPKPGSRSTFSPPPSWPASSGRASPRSCRCGWTARLTSRRPRASGLSGRPSGGAGPRHRRPAWPGRLTRRAG
jgi:SAM-dependent methyltransferase